MSGRDDVEAYVHTFGVDSAEAERRLRLQLDIGQLDAKLTTAEAQTYAGLWIEHQPDYRVAVRFTHDGDATLRKYVFGSPLENLIELRPATYSLAQLEADQVRAMDMVGQSAFDSSVNVFENRVDLFASTTTGRSLASSVILPPSTKLDPQLRAGIATADIYGGLPFNTDGGACTSGFSVRNSAGTKGVLTAGHCGNQATYNGFSLAYKAGAFGGANHEQWHTTANFTVRNWITDPVNGAPYIRTITSRTFRSNQPLNGLVCKYGRTTGYTCGTLVSKSFQPSWIPNATATYMQVRPSSGDMINGGDSGGPVFLNNSAYGLVEGEYGFPWCLCDLIFTATDYVESGLAVTILTY